MFAGRDHHDEEGALAKVERVRGEGPGSLLYGHLEGFGSATSGNSSLRIFSVRLLGLD